MGIFVPQKYPGQEIVDIIAVELGQAPVVAVVCLWELGFSVFGFGLWFKLGSPSVCSDYSPTGKNPWSCNRSKTEGDLNLKHNSKPKTGKPNSQAVRNVRKGVASLG